LDRMLIEYLPPIIQAIREMKAITDGQQDGLSALWGAIEQAFKDQLLEDATENGISRWEKIISVTPKGTDTLEERRFRIKTRMNEQLPYTMTAINQQLATLCGEDGYSIEMEKGTYTLYVKVALTAKKNFEDVEALLQRVVPAEIVIDVTLKYNQHLTLAGFTHSYLSAYTHADLREEVV